MFTHAALPARSTVLVLAIVAAFTAATAPTAAEAQCSGDPYRNLLVADQTANTVRKLSPTGADLGNFASAGLQGPTGLAFDRMGDLYVSNINGASISEFSATGRDLGYFATTGLNSPRGLAFD